MASAVSNNGDTAYGDGLIVRYVAMNLDTPAEQIHPVISDRGTSLRYGRIGMPAALWLTSAGQPAAMNVMHGVLGIAFGAATAGAAFRLLPWLGPIAGGLPFLAPGFPLALSGGFADAMAVPLIMWAVVFAIRERWWAASGVMAIALLTRENTAVALVGIGMLALARNRWGALGVLALAPVPALAWYAAVAARYGYLPPFDPYVRTTTDAFGPPVVALVRSFTDAASAGSLVLVAIHVALAVAMLTTIRRTPIAIVGAATTLQLLVSGPFAWELIGEGVRTSVFMQILFVVAIAAWHRTRYANEPFEEAS